MEHRLAAFRQFMKTFEPGKVLLVCGDKATANSACKEMVGAAWSDQDLEDETSLGKMDYDAVVIMDELTNPELPRAALWASKRYVVWASRPVDTSDEEVAELFRLPVFSNMVMQAGEAYLPTVLEIPGGQFAA